MKRKQNPITDKLIETAIEKLKKLPPPPPKIVVHKPHEAIAIMSNSIEEAIKEGHSIQVIAESLSKIFDAKITTQLIKRSLKAKETGSKTAARQALQGTTEEIKTSNTKKTTSMSHDHFPEDTDV